ncbi:MAG: glycosyltransferase, partial [Bacteroidota bacterium]
IGEPSFVGQRLAKRWGVPFVASVGGQEAKQPSLLSRRLDRKQATVTAGSAFASAWLARTTGRSADQVIPLGLDVEDWPRGPQPSKDIDVLGVGSLSTLKRYHEWIEVVRALAVEQPNLRAVLAGDGPERGRLEQLIQRYGLSRHIELLGLRPREEVLPLMRRARVLLHPSDYESQGYVFLEALHAGADVVSRPVGHRPPGPYVREANDVAGFVAATRTALARPARKPQAVPTTADTVAAFMSLYRGVRPPLGSDPAGGPTP